MSAVPTGHESTSVVDPGLSAAGTARRHMSQPVPTLHRWLGGLGDAISQQLIDPAETGAVERLDPPVDLAPAFAAKELRPGVQIIERRPTPLIVSLHIPLNEVVADL